MQPYQPRCYFSLGGVETSLVETFDTNMSPFGMPKTRTSFTTKCTYWNFAQPPSTGDVVQRGAADIPQAARTSRPSANQESAITSGTTTSFPSCPCQHCIHMNKKPSSSSFRFVGKYSTSAASPIASTSQLVSSHTDNTHNVTISSHCAEANKQETSLSSEIQVTTSGALCPPQQLSTLSAKNLCQSSQCMTTVHQPVPQAQSSIQVISLVTFKSNLRNNGRRPKSS